MRRYFPTPRKNLSLKTKNEDFVLTTENLETENKNASNQDRVAIISNYEQ